MPSAQTDPLKLYRTSLGPVLEHRARFYALSDTWDALVSDNDLLGHLDRVIAHELSGSAIVGTVLAPVESQEVWAAGVTYFRSRTARMEESEEAGGGTYYDRVYEAERPELFFKAAGWRVCAHDGPIRIRADATWNVPEPKLALYINPAGRIIGYTIGNDVSSRDIEGENPLYLPQAKIYDGSCALGPVLLVADSPLAGDTAIELSIQRDQDTVFLGATMLSQMRRSHAELVAYLYREMSFPNGCVLLTGTGVIPPDDFSLRAGDRIEISIPPVGVLRNCVAGPRNANAELRGLPPS